jgi:signal transduction histidine kinase
VVSVTTRTPRSSARTVASHRRGSTLPTRDLRVRTKLALVLTIPLLGFLAVTGVQVASSVATATQLDDFSKQVALGREVTALVHELQRERDRTAGILASLGNAAGARNITDLAPDRTAVDRAADALQTSATPLRGDPTIARAYQAVAAGLAELPRIRLGVQEGWLREQGAFDAYTRVIADLQALMLVPAVVGGDVAVSQAVRAFVNVSRAKELTAQLRGLLYMVCTAGRFGSSEFEVIADVRAQRQAAVNQFRTDANGAQTTVYDSAVSGQAVRTTDRLEQTLINNARASDLGVDAQQWWQASTTELELMRGVEPLLLDAAVAAAEARSASQWRMTAVSSIGSLLLLAVALLTSIVVGRSMVNTLRSLRAQALDVALQRLPRVIEQLRAAPKGAPVLDVEPIRVKSRDEVGEVAEAFTAVLRSAVRLATEQALMRHNVDAIFVNLARRSQTMVERQLQLLDELESSEEDPDQLANLFRLDHLATRMRRNDNNLLVLAGGETSRRWTEPVPLTAVILAAAAEIEYYTRVRHDIADNVHLVGHAVADVVHLVAELLENATIFSPPDTVVTVIGWAADDGGAALVIQDEGIGMSQEALARASQQVAAPVSIDVAAAERMGLVVVGHLAHRHGIRVQVRATGRGTAVLVSFPGPLVVDAPAETTPRTPARWMRTENGSIVAGDPSPVGQPMATTTSRRVTPTRAEDVLGAGRPEQSSVWWSRQATSPAATFPAARASTSEAVATTNEVGLPTRVPMANLPNQQAATAAAAPPATEPDPQEVGSVLSRFYGGVHQAALEDEDLAAAVKVSEPS